MCRAIYFQVVSRLSQSVLFSSSRRTLAEVCLSSHPYHTARAVHAGRDYPNVQDPGSELSYHGVQLECTIP